MAPAEPKQRLDFFDRNRLDDDTGKEPVDTGVVGVSDAIDSAREHPVGGQQIGQLSCEIHLVS